MVTLKDVAQKAEVSFQLVSAVLGNKSYARAGAKTRQRIVDAARELGYVPNISAQILQGGKSRLLGVMIDSQAPETTYELLSAIEAAAAQRGYRLLIAQAHNEPDKFIESFHALKQNGVDGFISLANDYPQLRCCLPKLINNKENWVFVGQSYGEDFAYIRLNIAGAMRLAVEHLKVQGYQKICLLIPKLTPNRNYLSIQNRRDGFLACCPEGRIFYPTHVCSESEPLEQEVCPKLFKAVRSAQVDAVIALNDYWATVVQSQALLHGLVVPQDLGLIGFDNRPICRCLPVKLTSVKYDYAAAAEQVVEYLQHTSHNELLQRTIEPQLVVRQSSQRTPNQK